MTFTTAAASEMRDRIAAVAGKSTAKKLTISTFHSFSLQLCRSHAEKYAHSEMEGNLMKVTYDYIFDFEFRSPLKSMKCLLYSPLLESWSL